MQLSILRRASFGRSRRSSTREIEQLELLLGDIEESDAEQQARTEASDGELLPPGRRRNVRPQASARSAAAREGHARSALRLPDLRRNEVGGLTTIFDREHSTVRIETTVVSTLEGTGRLQRMAPKRSWSNTHWGLEAANEQEQLAGSDIDKIRFGLR
jgi:hypothetical protein